jgi:hypothetical protein
MMISSKIKMNQAHGATVRTQTLRMHTQHAVGRRVRVRYLLVLNLVLWKVYIYLQIDI